MGVLQQRETCFIAVFLCVLLLLWVASIIRTFTPHALHDRFSSVPAVYGVAFAVLLYSQRPSLGEAVSAHVTSPQILCWKLLCEQ